MFLIFFFLFSVIFKYFIYEITPKRAPSQVFVIINYYILFSMCLYEYNRQRPNAHKFALQICTQKAVDKSHLAWNFVVLVVE